jgi:hypothetical protein
LLLNLAVSTLKGEEVLRVTDNQIRHATRSDIQYLQIPGAIKVIVPASEEFLPDWAIQQMRVHEPSFASDGKMMALGISVLKPGVVRVEGVWAQPKVAVIITTRSLSFVRPDLKRPVSLQGAGEKTVFRYVPSGTIDLALLGFEGEARRPNCFQVN